MYCKKHKEVKRILEEAPLPLRVEFAKVTKIYLYFGRTEAIPVQRMESFHKSNGFGGLVGDD